MKNPNVSAGWREVIEGYVPQDEREAEERRIILELMDREGDRLLQRGCAYAHLTASSIIVNPGRTATLMAFHRIYHSWAWTGGHADGEPSPEALARREAEEETGITGLRRLGGGAMSVEILPVWAHEKRGRAVGSHLHLNVSYLFEAEDSGALRAAPEENTGAAWLPVDKLSAFVTEEQMLPIYNKLIQRANIVRIHP